jgi:uncharacterized protein (TIGR02246 family)
MMTRLMLSVLLALGPSVCLAQSLGTPGDEAAIKQAIGRLRETVEKRDADLRAGLFTEDAVFYNAFGVEREGREAIREFWKYVFSTGTFSRSEFKITKEKIRFIRQDVAVVDIFEEVTGQRAPETGRELPPRSVQLTLIMTKKGNEWLVAHYRAGDIRVDSIAR